MRYASRMEKHQGACHCRNVRYEVTLDLSQPAIECNCSHCQMKGLLLQFVPVDQFEILQGDDELSTYKFNTHTIEHLFCGDCGVEAFGMGKDADGKATAAINLRTLDEVDLAAVTRVPYDGRSV
jgi:hypothetical protein